MASRPRRSAALANPHAPFAVPTVEEDPLVADNASEVGSDGEAVRPELDVSSSDSEAGEDPQEAEAADAVQHAELDEEEQPYEKLDSEDEDGDEDELVWSALHCS